MRLCIGTVKGIVTLDPERGGAPMTITANPSSISCLAVDTGGPGVIYAGSNEQVHMGEALSLGTLARSADTGRSWIDITPTGAGDERVWALAVPPDAPGEVLVGTSRNRLFRSVDYGHHFEECKGLPGLAGGRPDYAPPRHKAYNLNLYRPHVRTIVFNPANPATIYVALEAGGAFWSHDRGANFQPITGLPRDIHALAVDPAEPRQLYAAASGGFFRLSAERRNAWEAAGKGINRPYLTALAADRGLILAAGAAEPPSSINGGAYGADAQLFVSRDGGLSFESLGLPRRGMITQMVQDPGDHERFFAVTTDGALLAWRVAQEEPLELAVNLPPAYALAAIP